MKESFTLERKPVGLPAWPTTGFQVAAHVPLVTSAGHLFAPLHSGASINYAEDRAVSVIDCDYLPADKVVFPPERALLIVGKPGTMAAAFEEQALDQLTKDAWRALSQGAEPRRVIREMRL